MATSLLTVAAHKLTTKHKTAGRRAILALKFVERSTCEKTYHDSPLVVAQAARSGRLASLTVEKATQAQCPSWAVVELLEELVVHASTPQQRAFAGFFTLLVQSSARCADAQRSRTIRVVGNALCGESRMKNRKSGTKWVCTVNGFFRANWAKAWLDGLKDESLLGPDYILRAANSSMDAWLDRPAQYDDFRRALHVLCLLYGNMGPDEAVTLSLHSFRHVMVVSARQLRVAGDIQPEGLASLGHWAVGSAMPAL